MPRRWPPNTSAGAQAGPSAGLPATTIDPRRRAAAQDEPINAAALLLAHDDPERIALVCGGQILTYGELRDRVARAAGVWHDRGLMPGDRVAIKLPDGIDWVVAFLGTIWAGGVAVAVNPQIPAPEWQYILEEAGFNVIVAESADDTPSPWRERVILVEEGRRAVEEALPVEPHWVDGDTPAFWCHSSGTSGKPKAVVHRHGFAREIERVSRERLGITADDRLFATSRLFFSYPQTNSLFAGLKIGATVILDPQWPTAASAAATVAEMRPTVFFSVPSLYRNLLHAGLAPALVASGVRTCVSAGETLPASLRDAWLQATGIGMVDGYGASETLVLVLTGKAGDDGLQPSPGVEVHPLDPEAAASGIPTRLRIRVSTLALGYLDRPAAQAETFRDGAFCPADLFLRTEGGGWRFAGREDSLVKIKGRWVNLVELEEKLAAGTPGPARSRQRLRARPGRRRQRQPVLRGPRRPGRRGRTGAARTRRGACRRTSAPARCTAFRCCRARPPASCCGASSPNWCRRSAQGCHERGRLAPGPDRRERRRVHPDAGARAGQRARRRAWSTRCRRPWKRPAPIRRSRCCTCAAPAGCSAPAPTWR